MLAESAAARALTVFAASLAAAAVLAGCAPPAPPAVDSPLLTADDLAVLRTVAAEVVHPELRGGLAAARTPADGPIVVYSPTLTSALWTPSPVPHSMPPPSPFRSRVLSPPPPPSAHAVSADLLGPGELARWEGRNKVRRDFPELGAAGFTTRRAERPPCTADAPLERFVAFSSPVHGAGASAVVYVEFGRTCSGQGMLIRLNRTAGRWAVSWRHLIWIA